MGRLSMTYTVPEDEYEEDLVRLLKSSEEYVSSYSTAIDVAVSLLKSDNPEGCLVSLTQIRDDLAAADHRLHDTMNLIGGYTQIIRDRPSSPEPAKEVIDDPGFNEKLSKLKESVESIGLQLSDAEMKQMLEQANDTAS